MKDYEWYREATFCVVRNIAKLALFKLNIEGIVRNIILYISVLGFEYNLRQVARKGFGNFVVEKSNCWPFAL